MDGHFDRAGAGHHGGHLGVTSELLTKQQKGRPGTLRGAPLSFGTTVSISLDHPESFGTRISCSNHSAKEQIHAIKGFH